MQPVAKGRIGGSKTLAPPGGAPGPLDEFLSLPSSSSASSLHPEQSHGHTFDADRASIVAQVPTTLCFAAGNIILAVTSDAAVQTHNLSSFLQQPATLVSALPQQDLDAMEAENHAVEQQRSLDTEASKSSHHSASTTLGLEDSKRGEDGEEGPDVSERASADAPAETDLLAPKDASAAASTALSNAGNLLVSTLTHAPSFVRKQLVNMIPAQRIPPTVQSSHVVKAMCAHWFLDPKMKGAQEKEKVTLAAQQASSGTGDHLSIPRSPSSGSISPTSSPRGSAHPGLSLPSSSHVIHPCVSALAQNGQFLFSGGYFDGSLKCHSVIHYKMDDAHAPEAMHAASAASPRHSRSPTSPAILTSSSFTPTSNAVSANRAAIQTRRTVDCKPLSTVQAHHAPITAICLAANQSILFTGDANGSLLVWRVFTERHERNRPPLSSAPLASFPVHEGRVLSIASNTYVGVAVSLAMDMQGTRGCELCVYSVRGGTARFIRSQIAVDPTTHWDQVVLTSSANIVISGSHDGKPMLFLYSLNGQLLKSVPTGEVINVLYATPATAKTTSYEGFIVTGGRNSVVIFRSPHTLEPVQSFFCDDLFPQSVSHELAPTGMSAGAPGGAGGKEGAAPPVAMPARDLWDGSTSSGAGRAASPPTTASQSEESQAVAAHLDPMLSALAKDPSLPLRMGVAAFDIAPSQQHFIVSMYPPVVPPMPSTMEEESGEQQKPVEGRLLLFPLPHSSHDISHLGFYIDQGWQTLDTVRDALNARLTDTRDAARDKLTEARERWATTQVQATEKLKQAKAKIGSMFTGLFGSSSSQAPPKKGPGLTLPSALPPR